MRNILLSLTGDSRSAQRSIEEVVQDIRRMPDGAEVELEVRVAEARERLREMKRALESIDRTKVSPEISAEIARGIMQIETFDAELTKATRDREVDIDVRRTRLTAELAKAENVLARLQRNDAVAKLDADAQRLETRLAGARAELERIGQSSPFAKVDREMGDATRKLTDAERKLRDLRREGRRRQVDPLQLRKASDDVETIKRKLRELSSRRYDVALKVDADETAANAKIDGLERELEALAARRFETTVEAETRMEGARVDIEALRAQLASLPDRVTIDAELRGNILSDLTRIQRGVLNTTRTFDRANRPARTFGQVLSTAFIALKGLTPLLSGLGIVIMSKLVPALLAVAASAGAAVGGILSLGSAIAMSLVPAIALAVGVAGRLGKVMEALKAQDAAAAEEGQRTAEATKALAAAARARERAEAAVLDAVEGVASAERALANARDDAAQRIEDAQRQQADAARDMRRANEEVARATVDAFREMAQAAEDVRDAILGVQDAQLGLDEARLGVREAEAALRDLRTESNLSGQAFSSLFERFTDVDFDFDATALREALAAATGKTADRDKALEIERAILAVRRAKLGEKQATDRLGDSQRDLSTARQRDLQFQRQGIMASDGLRDALERQSDSRRALADATREANELERVGVDRAEGVIAAQDALRDAEQRLTEARKERGRVAQEGAAEITAAQRKARDATKELTGAERGLLAALKAVRTEVKGFLRPATDAVFIGMTAAVRRLPNLLNPLRGAFRELGESFGWVLDNLSRELTTPEWISAFMQFTRAAARMTRSGFGEFLTSLLDVFRDLALAALPYLVEGVDDLASGMTRLRDQLGGVAGMQPTVKIMVDGFKSWAKFAGAVGNAIIALIQAAGPLGNEFVDWLTDGVNAWAEWARSDEGRERIREFFERTLPTAKKLIRGLAALVGIFLRISEVASPFISGLLEGMSQVYDVLGPVVGLFADLASSDIGRFLLGLVGNFVALSGALRVMNALLGIGRVKILSSLLSPFKEAFNGIKRLVARFMPGAAAAGAETATSIATGLRSKLSSVRAAASNLRTTVLGRLRGWATTARAAASNAISAVVSGFGAGRTKVLSAAGRLRAWATSGLRRFRSTATAAATNLISGLTYALGAGAGRLRRSSKTARRNILRHLRNLKGTGQAAANGLVTGLALALGAGAGRLRGAGKKATDAIKRGMNRGKGRPPDNQGRGGSGLLGTVGTILGAIFLIFGPGKFFKIGKLAIQGLIRGIKRWGPKAVRALKNVGKDAIAGAKRILGIRSPSRVFAGIGKMIAEGLVRGVRRGNPVGRIGKNLGGLNKLRPTIPVQTALLDQLSGAVGGLPGAGVAIPAGVLGLAGATTKIDQHFNIPQAPAAHGQPDASFTAAQLAREMRRRGAGGSV